MENGHPRVLHLIKCLDRGGAERLVAAMATSADESRFQYEVAFVRSSMRGLVGEIERSGVVVHDLGARSDFDLTWAARLRRLLRQQHYEVLHAHLPYAAGIGRLVAHSLPRGRRPLIVYTEHSFWPRNQIATRVLSRLTSPLDDVIIAVSQSTRSALPRRVRRRTRVVRHGIETQRTAAEASRSGKVRTRLGVPPDHTLVLAVANLRPQKGYATLLAAARQLVVAGVPVTFLAAGHGPLEGELVRERDRLGLGERFRFLGQRDDVPALLAASDIFVLSSDWECMPVAVMEAFVLGTPVVATSVGELPHLIDHGHNGLLVPPGQPTELAEALHRLVRDAGLRRRLASAAARTGEQFDVRRARQDVEDLYAEGLRTS